MDITTSIDDGQRRPGGSSSPRKAPGRGGADMDADYGEHFDMRMQVIAVASCPRPVLVLVLVIVPVLSCAMLLPMPGNFHFREREPTQAVRYFLQDTN